MQTRTVVLPDLTVTTDRRKPIMMPMTYQIVFCGSNGVVIASDRLEGQHRPDGTIARGNDVTKIAIAGEFAWACSGGDLARICAGHLSERAKEMKGLTDEELIALLKDCRSSAFQQWGQPGPDSTSRILFVRGSNRSIFKMHPVPHTEIEVIHGGRGIAGQITNTAGFLFHRIYSSEMAVETLAVLSAYCIRTAHVFDSASIDGLNMAVYRDSDTESERHFQLIDCGPYLDCAAGVEDEIRSVFGRTKLV